MKHSPISPSAYPLQRAAALASPTFESELRFNIGRAIVQLKYEGTTAMSAANLQQVVPTPDGSLAGAPKGLNAQWAYSELFLRILREPQFTSFVLPKTTEA